MPPPIVRKLRCCMGTVRRPWHFVMSLGAVIRHRRYSVDVDQVILARSYRRTQHRPMLWLAISHHSTGLRRTLGPLLFPLYTAKLFDVIVSSGLNGHSYSDVAYISATASSTSITTIQAFVYCVERIDACMSIVYSYKTTADECWQKQLVWLGIRQQLDKLSTTELSLLTATVHFPSAASNLGVLIDSQLSMANHVASLSRSCFL